MVKVSALKDAVDELIESVSSEMVDAGEPAEAMPEPAKIWYPQLYLDTNKYGDQLKGLTVGDEVVVVAICKVCTISSYESDDDYQGQRSNGSVGLDIHKIVVKEDEGAETPEQEAAESE